MLLALLHKIVVATFIFGIFAATPQTAKAEEPYQPNVKTMELSKELKTWAGGIGGVAIDNLGLIYVSDFGTNVWRISQGGQVTLLTDSLYASSGNAIDQNGDLLQASHFNGALYKISRTGEITTIVEGELEGPVGVAVNSEGMIFVTNCWANNIVKINGENEVTVFSEEPEYVCPNGLTFDRQGNLYNVNFDNTVITKISPEGEASVFTTLPGIGNSHIAFSKGFFYVTQIFEHRIFKVASDGSFEVFVGDGTVGLSDGVGTEAQIPWPNGIAVHPRTNELYLNVFEGQFRNRETQTKIKVKVVELPTMLRVLQSAFETGGAEKIRPAFDQYIATYAPQATASILTGALSSALTRFIGWDQLDLALAVGELSLALTPEAWEPLVDLGDAYAARGNKAQAKIYFEKALEIKPADFRILARIEELLIP